MISTMSNVLADRVRRLLARPSQESENGSGPIMWARLVLFVAVVGSLAVATTLWGRPDPDQLQRATTRLGAWAPVVSTGVFVVITLGPVPKSVLATTAGFIFGLKLGIAIALVGGLLSAGLAFGLGRFLARGLAQRIAGRLLARTDTAALRHGLAAVIVARLSPIVPFALFNYAAGVTALGARPFFIGTAVGIVPGSVAYVALGTYGRTPEVWSTPTALLALGFVLVLILSGRSLARYLRLRTVQLPSRPPR